MYKKPSVGVWIFAACWGGILLFIDSLAVPKVVQQLRAVTFPSVTGVITASDPRPPERVEGKRRYRWTLEYRYTVAGREWTGDRLHFGTMIFRDGQAQAQRYTADYPVGKEVAVYYDPANPEQAVLRPGFLPEHLFFLLSLAPFHIAGFWFVGWGFRVMCGTGASAPLVLRAVDDLRMAVRMPWLAPWAVGMVALGAAALVGMLGALFFLPLPPSFAGVITVWGIVLGIAAWFAQRRRAQLNAGLADLIIDAEDQMVTLPLGYGRKKQMNFPFDEVHGLELKMRLVRTTRTRSGHTYDTVQEMFELNLIGPYHASHLLAALGAPEELRALGESMRDKLGWTFNDTQA